MHHLHGSLFAFRCDECGLPYTGPLPDMPEPTLEVEPPQCACGGLIRPDIVWFGEPLPDAPWNAAVDAVRDADLLVVSGDPTTDMRALLQPRVVVRAGHLVRSSPAQPSNL